MSIPFESNERFVNRHIGPDPAAVARMLEVVGSRTLDEFISSVVPPAIRSKTQLNIGAPLTEAAFLQEARRVAAMNAPRRSLIGMGYHGTITPGVILRNVLENPGWYTAYTPYQAEIAQGRLEALLNFQTMVVDLTGMEIANASLLDESTAAAEAMTMFHAISGHPANGIFLVSHDCHPQTIAVVQTRAKYLGIRVEVGDHETYTLGDGVFGLLLQYPASDGAVRDYRAVVDRAHAAGAHVVVAADLLALTLVTPPGEFGADATVGCTQRFGVPMGYGGPHAAFLATRDTFKRHMPGRIIGVSIDAQGQPALRMALQTREQHIRREKATSNICTAQVLLAVMAGMYAVYHGPDGLKRIATKIHEQARTLARALGEEGHRVQHVDYFDTLRITPATTHLTAIRKYAESFGYNFRYFDDGSLCIALDELTTQKELGDILTIFSGGRHGEPGIVRAAASLQPGYHGTNRRSSGYMTHPVFHLHHAETEMLRYIHGLETRDLSLNVSMIPLGSCTMKLNATTEMLPITWPEFASLHPFAPPEQAAGFHEVFRQLSGWLADITGCADVSLQPNAGAQGEYTGLLVIRAYHEARGEAHRKVCLIPASAHGTNPASAVMAGMQVVIVKCDAEGNIDVADLKARAQEHSSDLAALMVTYPSTHGVFEAAIRPICDTVHTHGGQVYMDGANMNAQVGLCRPAELGADVCHLNLHKTFSIPHGGGGPGMGPIAVARHLAPFLPGHPVVSTGGNSAIGPVSAAPYGSADVVLISWAYIAMMGSDGLTRATTVAILNANYMAKRLSQYYPVLFTGANDRVAHEFIIDLRQFKESAGIEAEDVAKRLMDYGFHAPTVSFPVAGTLMIEPTESETLEELDRFCDALISIRHEIRAIEEGKADRQQNVLKNAPHTARAVTSDDWSMPYSRQQAAYPAPWLRKQKFWPAVGRINNPYGDRNLVCTCPPVAESGNKSTT
jgi:glycine dehydrogenase